MDEVVIRSTEPLVARELRALLSRRWRVQDHPEGLVVFGAHSRVYVLNSEPLDVHQLSLAYSDEELVKAVLEVIADDPNLTVDHDVGVVLPGNQFVARIRAEPEWRWRS